MLLCCCSLFFVFLHFLSAIIIIISQDLFNILWWCKTYPKENSVFDSLPAAVNPRTQNNRRLVYKIGQRMLRLAPMMNDLELAWNDRWDADLDFPGVFDRNHRTMLDTFPVYVGTPRRFLLARQLFNPKYGGSVVKVGFCISCSLSSTFVFL